MTTPLHAEPVAWRVRTSDGEGGFLIEASEVNENGLTHWKECGWTVQPLYAAAAPAPDAWRYPVLTARGEALERMAKAMRNGKAWSVVFTTKVAEQLAEDALSALEAAAPPPTSLQKTQTSAPDPDEMREAIEQEVGRAVYERIETLMGRDSAELDYLTDFASSVEEYGSYSGPVKRLAAPALSPKQVDDTVEASSSVNPRPAPVREKAATPTACSASGWGAAARADKMAHILRGMIARGTAIDRDAVDRALTLAKYQQDPTDDDRAWAAKEATSLPAQGGDGPPAPDGLREAVWQAVMLGGDAWGITDRVIALLAAAPAHEGKREGIARLVCRAAGHNPDGPTCDIYIHDDPDAGKPWAGYRKDADAILALLGKGRG